MGKSGLAAASPLPGRLGPPSADASAARMARAILGPAVIPTHLIWDSGSGLDERCWHGRPAPALGSRPGLFSAVSHNFTSAYLSGRPPPAAPAVTSPGRNKNTAGSRGTGRALGRASFRPEKPPRAGKSRLFSEPRAGAALSPGDERSRIGGGRAVRLGGGFRGDARETDLMQIRKSGWAFNYCWENY